ncbi:hypothetical protein [Desertivirga brevis]|uniref:hypothetical protein n=1 Tax=Desertivirga brevis TaxID=2810310 RepID=UPI001A96CF0F|nr:hypothetical protein [Pedobacter sp. SYSU D00873]
MIHSKTFHIYCYTLIFSLFAGLNLKAQDQGLKDNQFKAGIKLLGAGASFEKRLYPTATLYSEASLNFVTGSAHYGKFTVVDPSQSEPSNLYYDGNHYYKYSFESKTTRAWMPSLTTEFRQYYNVGKRVAKKRKTHNNAFDFVGVGAGYYFKTKTNIDLLSQSAFMSGYATWGIQKSIAKVLSFEFNLGPGVRHLIERKETELFINGNLKLDLVIK